MGSREGFQCMGWGISGSRGWFMSVYGVGNSGEQRRVYVNVWGGG